MEMSTFCRLCAKIKSQRSLKTTMNDPSSHIKEKLIDCCSWNSFKDDDRLPQNICISCIKQLEQSWAFAEMVASAQTALYEMFVLNPTKQSSNFEKRDGSNIETNKHIFSDSNICHPTAISFVSVTINTEFENESESEVNTIQTTKLTEQSQNNISHTRVIASSDSNEFIDNKNQFLIDDHFEKSTTDLMDDFAKINEVDVKFEEDEIIRSLSKDVCNADGSITEEGVLKMKISCWNDYQFKCEKCSKMSRGVDDYRFHVESKHPNKHARLTFMCFDCPKKYYVFGKFAAHVATVHRHHLKYCCFICQHFYWDLKLLKKHVSHHQHAECKFKCETCGKSFRRNYLLKEHYTKHLPNELQNKCVCDICKKAFGKKENLRLHMLIHSGLRQHTCDQCGRSFTQKINLQHHILTHTKDRLFSCELCDKTFKLLRTLNKHKRIHTDIRPHKCKFPKCGKDFRASYNLKAHMRVHTGELPYACEYCEKKFRSSSVLICHRRIHTGERPYSCKDCNQIQLFISWSDFNKHMKRRHGIDTSSRDKRLPSSKMNDILPN